MVLVGDERSSSRQFEERDALVRRAACNSEELAAVARGESSVAFGDVGRDRDGGAGELVGENAVSAGEVRGSTGDAVREVQGATGQAEISRILQGLMGGVGFLGAGAVIQNKKAVRGLTTAAAVWVTAAVGAACGMGLYKLAGLVTFAQLFTLVILEHVEETYFPDHFQNEDDFNGKGRVERVVLDDEGRPLEPKG